MKLIILAAGFHRELHPVTLTRPAALISFGDKTLLDFSLENILPSGHISEIIIVTNQLFVWHFQSWARKFQPKSEQKIGIKVVSNGVEDFSKSRGAVYDIKLALEGLGNEDDLLIIGGDNLLLDSLSDFLEFCLTKEAPVVLGSEESHADRVRTLSSIVIDPSSRVTYFEEKPSNPQSTTSATLVYYLPAGSRLLVDEFLNSRGNPDRPGRFLEWMVRHDHLVFGAHFDGSWYDVSDPETLEEVQRIINMQSR